MNDTFNDATRGSEQVMFFRSVLVTSLQSLSPTEFEELCYLLVDAEPDYLNVLYTGASGSDSGRDIVAEFIDQGGASRSIVFQCKAVEHSKPSVFKDTISRLEQTGVTCDDLVFMTSRQPSATTIDNVASEGRKHGISVLFWGPAKLTALLYKHRLVLEQYFGGPNSAELQDISRRLATLESQNIVLATLLQFSYLALADAINADTSRRSRLHTSVHILIIIAVLKLIADMVESGVWHKGRQILERGPGRGYS